MNEDMQRQMAEAQELERLKRQVLTSILTKEAFERLSRVKSVNADLGAQAEMYLIQVYQSGKIRDLINDAKMKEVLAALSEGRKTTIRRV